ncbi:MAG: hypothetical protein U0930_01760 [Pirellulales bacterium]
MPPLCSAFGDTPLDCSNDLENSLDNWGGISSQALESWIARAKTTLAQAGPT